MKRIVALLLMVIAAGVVAAGGVILFSAAWNSTGIEWQRPWIAAFVVALGLWEAVAITAAISLWKHGYKPLAPFAIVMLCAATLFSFRYDVLNQIQAQSDRIAVRTSTVDRSRDDAQQLAALAAQQRAWVVRLETARGRELNKIREDIRDLNIRIAAINERLNNRQAVMEASPDAAFASRVFGHGTEAAWLDILAIMMVMALPIGRIVLTPIAIAFWQIAWSQKSEDVFRDSAKNLADLLPSPLAADAVTPLPEPEKTPPAKEQVKDEAPPLKVSQKVVSLPVSSRRALLTNSDMLRQVLQDMPYGTVEFAEIEDNLAARCLGNQTVAPRQQKVVELLATLEIAARKKGARGARYFNHLGRTKEAARSAPKVAKAGWAAERLSVAS